jgi:hypothetical protein
MWSGAENQTLEGWVVLAQATTFREYIIAGAKMIKVILSDLHSFPQIGYI